MAGHGRHSPRNCRGTYVSKENVAKVVHDEENELEAIYLPLVCQKKLYQKIGKVLIMDGKYGTNNPGFSLDHLLGEDNNENSQPLAQFFTKSETKESISGFLRIFTEV